MRFNIFGKLMSKNDDRAKPKNMCVKIDLNAYDKENRVKVNHPSLYTFNSFVEDIDRVANPKPLKNTELIEI